MKLHLTLLSAGIGLIGGIIMGYAMGEIEPDVWKTIEALHAEIDTQNATIDQLNDEIRDLNWELSQRPAPSAFKP